MGRGLVAVPAGRKSAMALVGRRPPGPACSMHLVQPTCTHLLSTAGPPRRK